LTAKPIAYQSKRPAMHDPSPVLPKHKDVDVERLAAIFDRTNQCYKFLFFQSLLHRSINSREIILVDILADMIEAAWWPAKYYRLTIAVGSKNHKMLTLLETNQGPQKQNAIGVRQWATELAAEKLTDEIQDGVIRWVRARLLRPWITAQEIPETKIDVYVARLTKSEADARNLPYFFKDNRTIEVRKPWAEYFAVNLPIITDWINFAWLSWVQTRNQNVSVTIDKLRPPPDRTSLQRQTAFLNIALSERPHLCIFTGDELKLNDAALDHFLPRSFVSHDRIWNLVPIAQKTNSSKGARLPRADTIIKLADLHSDAIAIADRGHVPDWKRFREEYSCDLRIEPELLTDRIRLAEAFQGTITPQLAIAKRMGFPLVPPGWPPRQSA